MLIDNLKSTLNKSKQTNPLYLRNLLKENLQAYVLSFVYSSAWGEEFLFKGGTCLRFCFDLPRLSEDLDFDIKNYRQFKLEAFLKYLGNFFRKQLQYQDLGIKVAKNKKQIYLKFPLMKNLGQPEFKKEVLFLRLDLNPTDSKLYQEKISLKTSYDFNFIIKSYSLSDLMASKIAAILSRSFFKGNKNQITFKGRDYFDLIWFLEKGVQLNLKRLKDIVGLKSEKEIFKRLDEKVKEVKTTYLREDLLPLFSDSNFVDDFVKNFHNLYINLRPRLT